MITPTPEPSPAPLVVVIVVNFNGGPMLGACLASLERQTFRDFQVIVVDNASTDGSTDQLTERFPRVHAIRSAVNLGFAAGNNLAIRQAGPSQWVALLNPDAVAQDQWLEQMVRAASEYPDFAMFGSRMLADPEGQRLDGVGDAYHVSGLPWRVGHGKAAAGAYQEAREIFAPCAAAALYRRDLIEATGGFDEDFFCYVEDVDLGFRARLLGYRALYVPGAVVVHEGSGVVGKHSDFQLYHGHRNLTWAFVRDMPGPLLAAYLPAHLLMTLATLLIFAIRGRFDVLWRAKQDAMRGLPRAIGKRGPTQATRTVSSWQLRSIMQVGWPRRYTERHARRHPPAARHRPPGD